MRPRPWRDGLRVEQPASVKSLPATSCIVPGEALGKPQRRVPECAPGFWEKARAFSGTGKHSPRWGDGAGRGRSRANAGPARESRRECMSGNRLALVADDERLGSALQTYLAKHLGQAIFQCKFDAIRQHLGRDTDGFLLLAVAQPAEAEQVRRLVQEICLQKLPPVILIAEHADCPGDGETALLDPYIAKRLRWPDDADELLDILYDGVAGSGQGFSGTG